MAFYVAADTIYKFVQDIVCCAILYVVRLSLLGSILPLLARVHLIPTVVCVQKCGREKWVSLLNGLEKHAFIELTIKSIGRKTILNCLSNELNSAFDRSTQKSTEIWWKLNWYVHGSKVRGGKKTTRKRKEKIRNEDEKKLAIMTTNKMAYRVRF